MNFDCVHAFVNLCIKDHSLDAKKASITYSELMRQVGKKFSPQILRQLRTVYKDTFDDALINNKSQPETLALNDAIRFVHDLENNLEKKAKANDTNIKNFHVVRSNLLRGSAPSVEDVRELSDSFGVKNIISLDKKTGDAISEICEELGISHVMLDINLDNYEDCKNIIYRGIDSIVKPDVMNYVHCFRGKDRTGFIVALVRVLLDNWSSFDAIKEAKKYGFGTGVSFDIEKFFVNLIEKAEKLKSKDNNDAVDIVSLERDNLSLTRDNQIDPYGGYSWAPYATLDGTYPGANFLDQANRSPYSTRQDLTNQKQRDYGYDNQDVGENWAPQVGKASELQQVTNSTGPSILSGGFL